MGDEPRTQKAAAGEPPRPEEAVADSAAQPERPEGWFDADAPDVEAPPAPPGPGPAADDAAALDDSDLDVATLRERAGKADEYLVLAQRKQAEFENFRKRMTREVAAAEARGIGRLAKELLPALDNLDRALAALPEADEGLRLVRSELSCALSRAGIEGYDPKGEPFDPAQHEAMVQQPVEGAASGTIVEVYQQGYRLADTVLRPARVVVAA